MHKFMKDNNEEFDKWMMDYMTGSLSGEDMQKFHTLLRSDIHYRKRFKDLSAIHAKLLIPHFVAEEADNYEKLLRRINLEKSTSLRNSSSHRITWKSIRRIAAVIVLLITSSIACYYVWDDVWRTSQDVVLCQMEVPLGSQTKVVLPDGSVVCLNSGSVLKYDPSFMKNKNRDVYLTGEGYFEVQKNQHKPFIVHTGDLNVKVLGTVFNVRAYTDESNVEIALVKGRVNVFSQSETIGNVVLNPNQRAVYDKKSRSLFSEDTDAKVAALWITGRLSFINTSLVDIMKELERHYNVRIIVESEHMKTEIFSGSINSKLSLEEMLDYLDVDNKYVWTRKDNVITITDK